MHIGVFFLFNNVSNEGSETKTKTRTKNRTKIYSVNYLFLLYANSKAKSKLRTQRNGYTRTKIKYNDGRIQCYLVI